MPLEVPPRTLPPSITRASVLTYFPFRGFRFASGEFEHASDGAARFYRSFFRHPDLRLERFERPDDFVQRNCFHESAFGLGIDRVELAFRVEQIGRASCRERV